MSSLSSGLACARLQLYKPPLAERTDPVVHLASSEHRKATRGAISSTSPTRDTAGVESMRGCMSLRNCSSLWYHWSVEYVLRMVSILLSRCDRPGPGLEGPACHAYLCNRARVHAVDRDSVRLPQLLGPDTDQGFVRCLGGCVYRLPGHTETGTR